MLARIAIVTLACLGVVPAVAVGQVVESQQDPPSEGPPSLSANELQFFESKIRPLLIDRCYGCHSAEASLAEGGLRLDSREAIVRGGSGGPALVAGEPESSLLIRAIHYRDSQLQMPPPESGGKLTQAEIQDLVRWVKMGAPDPRKEEDHWRIVVPDQNSVSRTWWSYQTIRSTPAPAHSDWAWNEIDEWIASEHRHQGLTPTGDAEPSVLLRRLHFDLTGLPPTPTDVEEFQRAIEKGSRQEAIANVVDRLLASPAFGEHFGRHWLDVARYGESSGREVNLPYNQAWRYRDWVIDAFCDNMPYDQFLIAQIAGDQVDAENEPARVKHLIGTGFLAIGSRNISETNPQQYAVDQADEQIDAVFQAFLGTTFACARCHDHKFEPISQADYTAVAGIFLSSDTRVGVFGGNNARNGSQGIFVSEAAGLPLAPIPWSSEEIAAKRKQLDEWKSAMASLNEEIKAAKKDAKRKDASVERAKQQELRKISNQASDLEFQLSCLDERDAPRCIVMGCIDKPKPKEEPVTKRELKGKDKNQDKEKAKGAKRKTLFAEISDSPFFARGEIGMPGEKVKRSVPNLFGDADRFPISRDSSGRLELARWMVDANNSLTARVAVNRYWAWLMGRGIVASVDNFGTTGSEPTHPELLDRLATQFRDQGWDTKALVRSIVTSRTYQLSSVEWTDDPAMSRGWAEDPENRYYWRGNRRRLRAEEIRDAMLACAGNLDTNRPVATTMAKHYTNKVNPSLGRKRSKGEIVSDDVCRSVYLPLPRGMAPEVLELFDLPDGSFVQSMREETNVPSQSLYLLNSQQVATLAGVTAKAMTKQIPARGVGRFDERIHYLVSRLLSRAPTPEELQWAEQLYQASEDSDTAWVSIVRGLMATAEFRYLD